MNFSLTVIITLLLYPYNATADSKDSTNEKKNLTANDLLLALSKLAKVHNLPRQRRPPNFFGNDQNYDDYYDSDQNLQDYQNQQIFPTGQQNPFQFNRRPKKQRYPNPYRPNYDYSQYPQYPQYPQYQQYPQQYPQQYQQQYPPEDSGYYPDYDPYLQSQYPQGPPPYPYQDDGPFSSFTRALNSIARYDDQQCVPRLLCEVAAGGNRDYKQSSFLPSFLSMDSLFTLLSAFASEQISPLLIFGRAAILGVTSQGNPSSCRYAYPECPRDPDRLVDYLNNHNGGFFRFFNGLQQQEDPATLNNPQQELQQNNQQYDQNFPTRPQQYPQDGVYNYRPGLNNRYPYRYEGRNITNNNIDARIQNKPIYSQGSRPNDLYIAQSYYYPNVLKSNDEAAWKFPEGSKVVPNYQPNVYPNIIQDDGYTKNYLKFPSDIQNGNRKKPKNVLFPSSNDEQQNQDLYFPTPLPFYDHSKMIFPDRTGTGNLKFDAQVLEQSTQRPIRNEYYATYNHNNYYRPANYDNLQQSSNKKYVYIVRGNGDPNHPEIVPLTARQATSRDDIEEVNDDEVARSGKPWSFPSTYQGVVYNDRSLNINE